MIPIFPEFKKLEYSDKSEVEEITRKYYPYSDFNFISMWSWNILGKIEISKINGNLATLFTDYITDEPFYSFIGNNKVVETAISLIDFSEEMGDDAQLKLIPEVAAEKISTEAGLMVTEDLDNFDYMYQLEKLRTYDGNKLRGRRNLSTRFQKGFLKNSYIKILNPIDMDERKEIFGLLETWVSMKKTDINENEFEAIKRAMNIEGPQDLVFVGLFINEILSGFVINEILKDEHVILHFEKADLNYVGVYSYLMQENAKILYNFGKRVLNYEQDLGLPGLRLAKKAYYPSHYLKKYIISRRPLPQLPKIEGESV